MAVKPKGKVSKKIEPEEHGSVEVTINWRYYLGFPQSGVMGFSFFAVPYNRFLDLLLE